MTTKKNVYVALAADFLHSGHLNIIRKARELGDVTIGLLTDEAIASYKRLPLLSYEQRHDVANNIVGVTRIVEQKSVDYTENLNSLKPDFVVHGDDWKIGPQSGVRQKVIDTLAAWNGELIEIAYTPNLSSTTLANEIRRKGITPDLRLRSLRRIMEAKPIVRILEVHNGLTGLIVENTSVSVEGATLEFDGMWESSLTDSTSKGKPDTSAVDVSSRVGTIDQILEVTTKPIIVDADNGGLSEHFCFTVRTLERLGVSAVIIEDKVGPKRNSLFGTDVKQKQDSIETFSEKITQGKKAQITHDFMIIARIESLILKIGLEDALKRAKAYIEAGADGIMIHSKEKTPDEVLAFCSAYQSFETKVPIVVVPTAYSQITESELADAGVKVVIYANHMLRSAFPAMVKTAESILKEHSCHQASEWCMPIKQIISLIPEQV